MVEETKRPKRPSVLIDPELYQKIAVIAAWRDVTIPDWTNNRLRSIVDEAFDAVSAEIAARARACKKPEG
jgi:hypothetical protein